LSDELLALLSRRQVLARASTIGLGALVASAVPAAQAAGAQAAANAAAAAAANRDGRATASSLSITDATLQAFADTIIPGRKATKTDLGNAIDPLAIAGVDPLPGAVQADALALYHHPEVGFDALEEAFLADLDSQSLAHLADFLHLNYAARVQVCLAGLDFSNPARLVWEAAAAIPFTAFCAAALVHNATSATASGYRVMGLPGVAPHGYRDFSYRRRLSTERTRTGSLP
jgi:enediyne biosynthesis protein E8